MEEIVIWLSTLNRNGLKWKKKHPWVWSVNSSIFWYVSYWFLLRVHLWFRFYIRASFGQFCGTLLVVRNAIHNMQHRTYFIISTSKNNNKVFSTKFSFFFPTLSIYINLLSWYINTLRCARIQNYRNLVHMKGANCTIYIWKLSIRSIIQTIILK